MSQTTTHSALSATALHRLSAVAYVPENFGYLLLALLAEPSHAELDWRERGLCAQTDPEAFFPEMGGSTRPAKRVCEGCEVRDDCLAYALEHNERFGIWGGTSEKERRLLRLGARTEVE